jgi:hypothetical protein
MTFPRRVTLYGFDSTSSLNLHDLGVSRRMFRAFVVLLLH